MSYISDHLLPVILLAVGIIGMAITGVLAIGAYRRARREAYLEIEPDAVEYADEAEEFITEITGPQPVTETYEWHYAERLPDHAVTMAAVGAGYPPAGTAAAIAAGTLAIPAIEAPVRRPAPQFRITTVEDVKAWGERQRAEIRAWGQQRPKLRLSLTEAELAHDEAMERAPREALSMSQR